MILDMKRLDEIKEADLQQLIADASPEKKSIDYKRYAIGGTDEDKKEFLADVSSFANSSGGFLILGMSEDNGIPIELCGLKIPDRDSDAEILRLENLIRDGIAPRILGIETEPVDIPSKGTYALVIRIPRSWQSPHMVTYKGNSRFYSRTSNGKYPLDVGEIRTAFTLSETASEQIRNFRSDRINKVISDETPISIQEGPKAVLHLAPLNAFTVGNNVDLHSLIANSAIELFKRTHEIGLSGKRLNFDGLLVYPAGTPTKCHQYAQVFRNGCIEYVAVIASDGQSKDILGAWIEKPLINGLPSFLSIQGFLAVQPPVFAMLTVLNVRGYIITVAKFETVFIAMESIYYPVDRDHLIIPEIVIENLQCNADEVLKEAFDTIWNASGWAGSINYDANGRWKLNRKN